MITHSDIAHRFTFHQTDDAQQERMQNLRVKAIDLADAILNLTPSSREQSLAITKLDEVVMWANAAIARNE